MTLAQALEDVTLPRLVSFTQSDPTETNLNVVAYMLTFSELVTGVDVSCFTLQTTGVSGASILSVEETPGSNGTEFVVTVSTGTGEGMVGITFDGTGIFDANGNTLPGGEFLPGYSFAGYGRPSDIAIADFNGDGLADIVVANYDGPASVMFGNGDGTFDLGGTYPAGFQVRAIAAADLDGDGDVDLVVPGLTSEGVSIYLNNGDGSFVDGTGFGNPGPAEVAIADVNDDGVPDLAIANLYTSTVSILIGKGDATFEPAVTYSTGLQPHAVELADVNGDGVLDMVTADAGSDGVSILIGVGDGTFLERTDLPVGNYPVNVAIADVNSDGFVDIVAINGFDNTASVLIANGDGSFHDQIGYTVGDFPQGLAIVDLNADGVLDIAVTNTGSDTASVLYGAGGGTFHSQVTFVLGDAPQGIGIADFNGDGIPDMAIANVYSNIVSIVLNDPPPEAGPSYSIDRTAPSAAFINALTDDVPLYTGVLGVGALTNDSDLTLTVDISGTAAKAGDSVLIYEGAGIESQIGSPYVLTEADIAQGFASVQTGALADGDHTLTVRITDVAGNQSGVSVNSLSFNIDATAPTITSYGGAEFVTKSVFENNSLVSNLSASDPDGSETFAWSITGGEDASLFEIRNGTELHFVSAPDYEALPNAGATSGYQFQIQVTDDAGGFDFQTLSVLVSNIVGASWTGSIVSDFYEGTSEEDWISGNDGNDTLNGVGGSDKIFGDNGDDVLDGGTGNDILDGGAGQDIFRGGSGNDVFIGGGGIDQDIADYSQDVSAGATDGIQANLHGSFVQDGIATDTVIDSFGNIDSIVSMRNIVGTQFEDIVYGGGNANVISVGAGNDYVFGHDGNDTIFGGAGNDILRGGNDQDSIYGEDGNDILLGGIGDDLLDGGAGIDTASFALAGISIKADLGNTKTSQNTGIGFDLFVGIENVIGSNFNDTLTSDLTAANELRGGLGDDQYYIMESSDQAIENAGEGTTDRVETFANITLVATSEIETIVARLTTGMNLGGSDTANWIAGNAGNDSLNGNSGNDTLNGLEGHDALNGGDGEDVLKGGNGDDILSGMQGNDLLDGGLDNDTLNGDAGEDTASYESSLGGIIVNLAVANAQDTGAGIDILSQIENLIGSAFNDVLFGSSSANVLFGGGGNDSIDGGSDNDTLNGASGNDTLTGGAGNDLLDGGDDIDTVSYATAGLGQNVSLLLSTAGEIGGQGVDTLLHIESIIGSGFNDMLAGDTGANQLDGNNGADSLSGDAGSDTLNGGSGNDTISGGDGNDVLSGGDDRDVISGGNNNDIIDGGLGNDSLSGDIGNDFIDGNLGNDMLEGGDGNDALNGGDGNDSISGGNGNETIDGGVGNDTITGGVGNDIVDGGTGRDHMTGGAGNDFYTVDDAGDVIIELAGEGAADTVNTALASLTLAANVERLNYTGSGNFVGIGNSGDNRFTGGALADRFVDVAGGNDTVSGGNGSDSMDFRGSSTGVVLNFITNIHGGAAAGDVYSSMEKYFGSNTADDSMTGGGAGRFVFTGGGGNDTLVGAGNIDNLQGQAGNDSISGLAGIDTIDGGVGNDTLMGGAALDLFVFSAAGFGQDIITDFEDGLDRLKVHSSIANNISAFSITGNGSTSVLLTQISSPTNTITLNAASAINITAADFVFY